jgi:hypothetical protein
LREVARSVIISSVNVTITCVRQLKLHVVALILVIKCGGWSKVNNKNRKKNSNDCDYVLKSFAGNELNDVLG